jgi:two-component system chemotaxis sensor kinase CheA
VAAPAAQAGEASTRSASPDGGSIRVSIEKIDELLNSVGELVITQSVLSQLAAPLEGREAGELRSALAQLERHMRALQESVMRVRMLPISFVFNRFPRLVRDLGQRLGKKIELKVTGDQTELDKTVLEKIGDPLVHLVRNSIDHGIEMPDVRAAAGKSEHGTISLHAYHKGGNVIVEVSDDGGGLRKDKILAKALERGLVTSEVELSEERILNLIFAPGFSTADVVSDVSGRGVGMDVVRRNINELGGHIQIFSTQGQGSTIRIRLPLTLAILDGQLARVGKEVYVVPIVSIVETIQVTRERVNSVGRGGEVFRLRDDYLPIVRLHALFDIEPDHTDLLDGLLMIVEADGKRVGLFVDELMSQQQVVIKSLETNFKQITGLAGATMLGDGRVALILDIPGVITRFQDARGARCREAAGRMSNTNTSMSRMKFSNLKVGKRLGLGFGVLLIACLSVGGIGWYRLAQLDKVVNRITTENWEKARLTMEMEIRTRDNAFKTGRVLMAGDDMDAVKSLKDEMAANTQLNSAALKQLEKAARSRQKPSRCSRTPRKRANATWSRARR